MLTITLYDVSKRFRAYSSRNDRWLRRELTSCLRRKERLQDYRTVLERISLEVAKGEIVGLIGRNGTGKTTLLKLIAGILQPTSGRIVVEGSVCALLELGAGFSLDLTGRENVFLYGSILGLEERHIRRVLPDILEFADLDGFLDTPLKYYSTGMRTRLGFAIATSAEPDVFLIDEVLSVGDQGFREKCERKLRELIGTDRTIVLVTHDLDAVRRLCTRAVWLEDGCVKADGPAREVASAYEASFSCGCPLEVES